MMRRTTMAILMVGVFAVTGMLAAEDGRNEEMGESIQVWSVEEGGMVATSTVEKSDAEWKRDLPPETYKILRRKGTEMSCSGAYWKNDREGVYRCAACGTDLFVSTTKFTSGTGWPSFFQPVHDANIGTERDSSYGMVRTEVHCRRCGGHLGHVFDDGPKPTGRRYCINSAAMEFEEMDLP